MDEVIELHEDNESLDDYESKVLDYVKKASKDMDMKQFVILLYLTVMIFWLPVYIWNFIDEKREV